MRNLKVLCILALVLVGVTAASGQTTQPATQPADQPAATLGPPPASQPAGEVKEAPADKVAVTVNGHQIMESDLEAVFEARMRGRQVPEERKAQMRLRARDRMLNGLIDKRLFEEEIAREGIEVTEAELAAEAEKQLRLYLAHRGITREELDEEIRARSNKSVKQALAERLADPGYRDSVLRARLIEKKFANDLTVTEEEIKDWFDRDPGGTYQKPAQVKASHVLLRVEKTATEEEKAAIRKKMEDILTEARKPDADFAALAEKHSDGPSKTRGGDVGYFPRHGKMEEQFAEAAFALQPGAISDIVETRFGYHIIKVTDKKKEVANALELARDTIREQLRNQKIGKVERRHIAELRKSAKIEYPQDVTTTTQPAPKETSKHRNVKKSK